MSNISVTSSQKKALAVAVIIAIIGGWFFLKVYFTLIILALVLSYLFMPVYNRLNNKWNKPGRASMATLLIAFFTILIPLIFIILISVKQVDSLIDNFDVNTLTTTTDQAMHGINNFLSSLGIDLQIDKEALLNQLESTLKEYGQTFIQGVLSAFSSFISFITLSIIFIYVFLSLLRNHNKLAEVINKLNPLGEQIGDLYMNRIGAMTKAMVRGQFIVAAACGFADAALLAIAGLPDLFFFFFLILTALSVIPLGGGIVAIPIGIVMMLTGNVVGGVIVVGGHLLIVTNIDNILRPRLVPKEAKLDAALTMLSVFAGIHAFGFIGIVIGPVIMIAIVTTIQVFLEVYRGVESENKPTAKAKTKLRKVFSKLRSAIN